MKCIDCGASIPARLRLFQASHCVKCVDKHIPERKGYMIYGHKTIGEIVMATGENIRRLERDILKSIMTLDMITRFVPLITDVCMRSLIAYILKKEWA